MQHGDGITNGEEQTYERVQGIIVHYDSGDITDFGGILLAVGFGGKIQKIIWTKAIQKYLFCGHLKTVFLSSLKGGHRMGMASTSCQSGTEDWVRDKKWRG